MGDFFSSAWKDAPKAPKKIVSKDFTLEWNEDYLIGLVGNAVDVATKEGAERVARRARQKVVKKTGTLSLEIDVRKSNFKDGGYSVYAQGPGNYHRFYAIWVELGAPGRNIEAQPFLRPALRAEKNGILKAFEGKLK